MEDGLSQLEQNLQEPGVLPTKTKEELEDVLGKLCKQFKDSVLSNCLGEGCIRDELKTRLEVRIIN